MASATLTRSERLERLLAGLGLECAHFAVCMSSDWSELVTRCAGRMCSFTVVAPHLNKGIPDGLQAFDPPSLVITGDRGAPAERARELAGRIGRAELLELGDYESPAWADTIADRTTEVAAAIGGLLARAQRDRAASAAATAGDAGEIAGIRYRIDGQGPALVLLPLSMAPSQWQPLIPHLSDRYSVIQLGGRHLGVTSLLEARASSGYGDLAAQLLEQTKLAPGETVLEVGCGSGALTRNLARRLGPDNKIVATDISSYLLSEARALTSGDDRLKAIAFEQANAETLPYADASFDVTFCCTVLEEGDADRMIAELARVTRPGGRVAVMTRAIDVDWWINLPVDRELRRKMGALGPYTGAGVGPHGCADMSLYARIARAGLTPAIMGPQFAIYRGGERLEDVLDRLVAQLSDKKGRVCRDAMRQAETDGVLFAAEPFHCAVARR